MPQPGPGPSDGRPAAEPVGLDYGLPATMATPYMRRGSRIVTARAPRPCTGPTCAGPAVAGRRHRLLTARQDRRCQAWSDDAHRLRGLLTDLEEHSRHAFHDADDSARKAETSPISSGVRNVGPVGGTEERGSSSAGRSSARGPRSRGTGSAGSGRVATVRVLVAPDRRHVRRSVMRCARWTRPVDHREGHSGDLFGASCPK
jgi:hypothetical protein